MSGFTLPTSRPVTQAWGAEFDDWDGDGVVDYPGGFYHSIGWDGHNGIDYGCYEGDPVEAVADGVVAFAGDAGNWHAILSGGGNAILIQHPEYGVQTEYLHLSRWLVEAGQTVKRGQVIGRSGRSGAATAPHLHLGMLKLRGYNLGDRWRGRIDPTPWLYGNLNPDYAGSAAIAPQGTTITPKDWFDMATEAQLRKIIREENPWGYKNKDLEKNDTYAILRATRDYVVKNNVELAALKGVMSQLAAKQGVAIDYAKIDTLIKDNLAAGIDVDINVNGGK